MSQLSFADAMGDYGEKTNTPSSFKVGFFALKDNEEAVVRFAHDDAENFEMLAVHSISLNGKYRQISCCRDPRESLDKCPLCASGAKIQKRAFLHLVQYVKDPTTGAVVGEAKVWNAPISYAVKLRDYIGNYGPLSNIICKIIRHGSGMDTKYEIIPNLSKEIYRDDIYVKDMSAFDGYHALGTMVLNKTTDEVAQFLATGNFPEKEVKTTYTNPQYATPQTVYAPVNSAPTPVAPTTPVYEPAPSVAPQNVAPWEQDIPFNKPSTEMARPKRFY